MTPSIEFIAKQLTEFIKSNGTWLDIKHWHVSKETKKAVEALRKFNLPNDYHENNLVLASTVGFLCLCDKKIDLNRHLFQRREEDGSPHMLLTIETALEKYIVEIGNLRLFGFDKGYLIEDNISISEDLEKRCLFYLERVGTWISRFRKYQIMVQGLNLQFEEFVICIHKDAEWKMKFISVFKETYCYSVLTKKVGNFIKYKFSDPSPLAIE